MESDLNKKIELSTNENLIIIKSFVDHYLINFDIKCDINERNLLIMKIFDIVIKRYLASENSKFEKDKENAISIIVKSYLIEKFFKSNYLDLPK